jgi:hypothetical protein
MKQLKSVIKQLNAIIDLLAADPKNPTLSALLLKAQVDLAKATHTIIGGGDERNQTGS